MALDRKTKKAWVKALRSGKYKQGFNALKRTHEEKAVYCCLGVLCNIKGVRWRNSGTKSSFTLENTLYPYMNNKCVGNRTDESGLINSSFCDLSVETQKLLALKNDDGWSFNDIADYIERRL